jgi:hypothetical protein
MPRDITQLDHPIDVMYLIHKAIREEARRTRRAAEQLEIGGNFKPFMEDFYRWAMALGYHEEAESKYVLPCLPDMSPARYNEIGHKELLAGLEDLQMCLHEELGRTIVIPRTQRQLCGKVIALLIAQADLLEEEEELLLPAIRQHLGEAEQLEMARHLLFDFDREDERWMLDWVAQNITEAERQVLAAWVARLETVPHALPSLPRNERAQSGSSQASTPDRETAMLAAKTSGEHPIDVMYLIHKALSAEAWRAVSIAERLDIGANLQPFRQAFARWEKTLGFHADREDTYMTPLLPASALARDNEMAHQRLAQRLEAIRTSVREIGNNAVTTRTRRRLFGKVVALRIDQDDHLEEEEELVLPIIRERLSAAQQLEIAQRLLLDPHTEDESWVVAWLMQELTEPERHALAALMARFASIPCPTIDLTVPSQDHQTS